MDRILKPISVMFIIVFEIISCCCECFCDAGRAAVNEENAGQNNVETTRSRSNDSGYVIRTTTQSAQSYTSMDTGSTDSLHRPSLPRVPSAPQLTSVSEVPSAPPQLPFTLQMPSAPPQPPSALTHEFDSPPNYEEAMNYVWKK